MNDQAAIVPPSRRPSEKTFRRALRRRKARACAQISFCCAAIWLAEKLCVWALPWSTQEGTQGDWVGVLATILGVVAIVSGVLSVVFRFTERPRETLVECAAADRKWPIDPPVIHARQE